VKFKHIVCAVFVALPSLSWVVVVALHAREVLLR
jgi:hypothetical protein